VSTIAAQEPRLNEQITVRECRLIGYDGNQMGIYPTVQARRIAGAALDVMTPEPLPADHPLWE